jgi:GNAT superfamily N-acetyltransferase
MNKNLFTTLKYEDIVFTNRFNYTKRIYRGNFNEVIGQIEYTKNDGQIRLLYIAHGYRNQGLGKEMLIKACEDIKADQIWLVSSEDHYFWNKYPVFNFKDPAHDRVTGLGFYADRKKVIEYMKRYQFYQDTFFVGQELV